MKNKWLLIFAVIVIVILLIFFFNIQKSFFKPTDSMAEEGVLSDNLFGKVEIIAEDLEIPWEIVFLPDGELLVTERSGNLVLIEDKEKIVVEGVEHIGEGGLLGLTLHPNFEENKFLYLYLTTKVDREIINRVERYTFENNKLSNKNIILDNIPGASFHDGGRIEFGPDGFLYITTGDAGQSSLAQDVESLAGKILRLDQDGNIPPDNPFNNEVFSYGHRNPQGIDWDKDGILWSSEHGPSGTEKGRDEINRISKGNNYGWPIIRGSEEQVGMVTPVVESGIDETWAPGDILILNDKIFFSGLRGVSLYELRVYDNDSEIIAHFRSEFGRIRSLVLGPDGYLYFTTSNRDRRGKVLDGDDKIIRVNPDVFD